MSTLIPTSYDRQLTGQLFDATPVSAAMSTPEAVKMRVSGQCAGTRGPPLFLGANKASCTSNSSLGQTNRLCSIRPLQYLSLVSYVYPTFDYI